MLDNWDTNKLAFTPTCLRSTYNMQIKAMTDYIAVLEARAVMEGIEKVLIWRNHLQKARNNNESYCY